jgi:2-methylcitrate dehydratase PrpD
MDYLDEVAHFASSTSFDDLPSDVVAKSKLIIADCVAAIVAGAAEPEMIALTQRMVAESNGNSIVIGTGSAADPGLAALLNGSAGTFLEQDEGNQFCKGHPGMHTLPAVLATAADCAPSGQDFLAALTVGYEVGARVGISSNLRGAMHPHGTWGVLCAAVGAARLHGFDQGQMKTLINVASSLSLATSKKTMLQGGSVRNIYTGVAGQLGILACTLVKAGFTGERDGLSSVFGSVVSDSFDIVQMTEELGVRWEVSRNYFKLHSCCRYNHAALDALQMISKEHPEIYNLQNIKRVDIATYSLAAELNDQSPANTLAAKFSLPFAIATTLAHGSSEYGSFTWEAVRTFSIQEFSKRVFVAEDLTMSAQLPNRRPARITITMTDGRRLEAATETNRGDWRDPYSQQELRVKYDNLTGRLWNIEGSNAVYCAIMALSETKSVDHLILAIGTSDQAKIMEKDL